MKRPLNRSQSTGFTIIELLVVVIVIGILATIVIVAYNNIQGQAHDKTVLSDMDTLDGIETDYGTKNNVAGLAWYSGSGINASLNFTPSPGDVIDVVTNSTDYCIRSYNPSSATYKTLATAAIKESTTGVCASLPPSSAATTGSLICPSGFIVVPGSATYGTSSFCVMKYEAKNVGGVATSQVSGTPWTSISQTSASTASNAACSGCHLISEAEWLTIAQNVLQVPSNWTSGSVGSGAIYSGHNDNSPSNSLAASTDDNNGYYGTGNVTPSTQRRTLTLSNGQVIWDLAGNVLEWTSGTISTTQLPTPLNTYTNFNSGSLVLNGLASTALPSGAYSAASGWDSWTGIGILDVYNYNSDGSGLYGYDRGGYYADGGSLAGVFSLELSYPPSSSTPNLGFRVTK